MTKIKPTALITGGAKRVGAAIAAHLAARGYDLVLHYHRSHGAATALAKELQSSHGTSVRLHPADLEQTESLDHFWQGLPACELLVLSAATYERDTLETMTAKLLQQQLAVNLQSPLLLAQGFMAQLPADRQGNIVVLGDGGMGWSVSPEFFSYAVSKHAWSSVIDLLAAAVAPKARANLLALAPMLPNAGEDEALFKRLADRAALQRTGTTDEVCTAIDFLLASPGVTGQAISLGNGMGLATARPLA
jgi:NAD(P)-dependent dehydrogenase (short-subunit alcohol dehydrogenase family)